MPFHPPFCSLSALFPLWGFPCGSAGKESARNAGHLGSIPGLERSPGEGKGYPLQYSGLETSMDCSPWGRKVSDTTERLSLHFPLLLDLLLIIELSPPIPGNQHVFYFSNLKMNKEFIFSSMMHTVNFLNSSSSRKTKCWVSPVCV